MGHRRWITKVGPPRTQEERRRKSRYREQDHGIVDEGIDIEPHPADNEERRDEEPEPEAVELRLDQVGLAFARPGREQAEHHAGHEGAQDDVEADSSAIHTITPRNNTTSRMANCPLVVRVVLSSRPSRSPRGGWRRTPRRRRSPRTPGGRGRSGRSIGRQRQSDRDQGQELAGGRAGQHLGAEVVLEVAAVAQDREEHPECGRGHRQPHDQTGSGPVDRDQGDAQRHAQDERHQPSSARSSHRASPDPRKVDLEAGEEHQRGQAEHAEEGDDVVVGRPVEHRTDDDPAARSR